MSRLSFYGLTAALWCSALTGQTNSPHALLIEDVGFIPSGWMGDAEKEGVLQVDESSTPRPQSRLPHSEQWTYRPKLGRNGWAAVAWQFPENNWGQKQGKDWSTLRLSRVTVWARGVRDRRGNFPKLQFKAGGNTNPDRTKYPYQASFEVESDFVTLTEDWKQYSIDLTRQNLSQVVSAFTVVLSAQTFGSDGGTFYLDEIEYSQGSVPFPNAPAPALRQQAALLPPAIWVAYAPTHYNPGAKPPVLPTDESIRADLAVLHEAGFNGLVTYGAELPTIPRIAQAVGFTAMLLGIWSPGDATELRNAKEAGRSPIVVGVIVGNEGLTFHRYTLPVLHGAMEQARREIGKPVSTTEVVVSYFTKPELTQWSDFLAVNAHPYFHEIHDPVRAVEWTEKVYANLRRRYPDKEVLFKEVGIPTAAPGLNEKAQYEYYGGLKNTSVKFVFFEAFDALFKNGPTEQSWGIFHADRSPKPAVSLVQSAGKVTPRTEGRP
jgi:exo-beta-1,3-glucanase (GH17 family)